jgi:hypothetical protein
MLHVHTTEHGYTEVEPPFMANRSLTGTGNLPVRRICSRLRRLTLISVRPPKAADNAPRRDLDDQLPIDNRPHTLSERGRPYGVTAG